MELNLAALGNAAILLLIGWMALQVGIDRPQSQAVFNVVLAILVAIITVGTLDDYARLKGPIYDSAQRSAGGLIMVYIALMLAVYTGWVIGKLMRLALSDHHQG